MKKIFSIICLTTSFFLANAQKFVPEIKTGSQITATAIVGGQEFPLALKIVSATAPYSIGWGVDGYGEGSFEMSEKAFSNGTELLQVSQPALGVTKLSDAQTFIVISKDAFKTLVDKKSFTYGGQNFKIKTPASAAIKLNGKEVDVFHVANDNASQELWILNNPAFPLIIQSTGQATDIVMSEIK
ncbi:hypothetical protein QWY86_10475 [Pedobacter aquatilis]|uniref:hypothetical protein n=1 Tax=Pedobacter aquatilis TaxID=351343 RepID=UPI0025B2988F|nr:hypothetical protein [Pedobacter aquatilis]MDN3587095.1 hypothetical protein [Pedobacter aquatilis]